MPCDTVLKGAHIVCHPLPARTPKMTRGETCRFCTMAFSVRLQAFGERHGKGRRRERTRGARVHAERMGEPGGMASRAHAEDGQGDEAFDEG